MSKRNRKHRKRAQAVREPGELPTPEQIMRGEAVRDFVTHAETATKAMAHRVAHDPIEKWKRAGKLTPTETATIERMQDIWQAVHGEVSLTASYSDTGGGGCEQSLRCQEKQLALRDALRAVEGEFKGVMPWYNIFERICRFGEHPLEVAGNREKALTVVRLVANFIAAKRLV